MLRWMFSILLVSTFSCGALAQSASDLANDANTTEDIVTYGMGHGLQRYSPLTQINPHTIRDLVPAWSFAVGGDRGQEAQPLLYKGVLYITTHDETFAIDAKTGKKVWNHKFDYPDELLRSLCCGVVNRGAAIYQGKVIRQTLDNLVIALDINTGKEVWRQQAAKWEDDFSMTGAPLVANETVITGVGGAEFGTRCFLDGWDAETGEQRWHLNTIPGPDEPGGDTWSGDSYKRGGGCTWLTGSYDPKLDLVYWGIGNPAPWNAANRLGDNLYTASVLAIRPRTGEIVWYYQFTPNDTYDFDGTNELVHASLEIDGEMHDVVMQANRNGYFYVLDRKTGKLLRADPFVDKITWADRIDMKTGRPVRAQIVTDSLKNGTEVQMWPGAMGGKNWAPMSYSPDTGLVYVNANENSMKFKPIDTKWRKGILYSGYEFHFLDPLGNDIGRLRAINPATGKRVWEVVTDPPANGGTLVTAGKVVFTGLHTGELLAFHAETGEELWRYQTGSGVIAPSVTYSVDGVQYVAVMSGIGGLYPWVLPHEGLKESHTGGLLTVFKLHRPAGN